MIKIAIIAIVCIVVFVRKWQSTNELLFLIKERKRSIEIFTKILGSTNSSLHKKKMKIKIEEAISEIASEKLSYFVKIIESIIYLSPIIYLIIKK